jgi:Protein of unknown function (DUF1566)
VPRIGGGNYDLTECVLDNQTGLIWQGQTASSTGLRANNQVKTNFDSTTALQKFNGSFSWTPYVSPTQADIDAITNTIGFKNAVNAANLCGSNTWRLPTVDELLTIVKTNPAQPMIDIDWFPNTGTISYLYWTSSPNPSNSAEALTVSFYFGGVISGDRSNVFGSGYGYVRLVR